jgi:hypothetical protein
MPVVVVSDSVVDSDVVVEVTGAVVEVVALVLVVVLLVVALVVVVVATVVVVSIVGTFPPRFSCILTSEDEELILNMSFVLSR